MKPLVYKKSRTRADAREPERHKLHIAKGDTVRIVETRPLSKRKRWRVVEIVERAK